MFDWSIPFQTQHRFPAKVIHEYYNGVQDMVVVAIDRGPMTNMPNARHHEIIKIYDKRWGMDQTNGARSSMDNKSEWDLRPVPPPDTIGYVTIWNTGELVAESYATQQDTLNTSIIGQIKVTVDGATNKIKSIKIL